MRFALNHPQCRDAITRDLWHEGYIGKDLTQLLDERRSTIHTSSGERKVVTCCLSARFRTFMGGSDGRKTPCGPRVELSGRRSFPPASPSSVKPSLKLLGLGGQPGT